MDDITLVTAYFKLERNKYNTDYIDWMGNLLLNLDKNLIIFTDEFTEQLIKDMRKNYENKTLIIKMKLNEFHSVKYLDYFIKDHLRDKYRHLRNPNLYMIWNEKLKFIEKAIDINPFKTNYFSWIDIGYVRNKIYVDKYIKKGFPDISKLTEDKIYMLNIDYNFTKEDFIDPYNSKFQMIDNKIGGGFIIGNSINLKKMIKEFYEVIIPEYIKRNYFLGEDQTLYTSLYLKRPDLITLIKGNDDETTIQYCQMRWFYFLKYLTAT